MDGQISRSFEDAVRGLNLSKIAPFIFVGLWSTGFVGAKYGLPFADPFIFLSIRVFLAALILVAVSRLLRAPLAIGKSAISRSAVIGFFLHTCYLGGVFYAISVGISAGVAAVVTSLQPIIVSLIGIKVLGEKVRASQLAGLVLGLVGVVLVLGPAVDAKLPLSGVVAIFVALMGSTVATVLQKRVGSEIPILPGTAYQYMASGVVLLVAALATGGMQIEWSLKFTGAFIWLVGVLSVGAVLILLWLLNNASAAKVSSLFYLVPPATAVEAYFLFGEKVNTQGFLGIGVTALGVWLVMRS